MLKSTDGNHEQTTRRPLKFALLALMLTAVGSVSLRSMATADNDKKVPVKTVSRSEVAEAPSTEPTSDAFGRAPISVEQLGDNRNGLFLVRWREVAAHPTLKSMVPMLTQTLFPLVQSSAGLSSDSFDESRVDWVGGAASVKMDRNVDSPDSANNSLSFGTGGTVVCLNRDVNLAEWVQQHAPDAQTNTDDAGDYFELQGGELGLPTRLQQESPRLIRVGLVQPIGVKSVPVLHKVPSDVQQPVVSHKRWYRSWNKVSGAVAAVVFTDANIRTAIEPPSDGNEIEVALARLADAMTQRCTCFAYGLDFDGDDHFLVQVRLTHASVAKAYTSLRSVETIKKMAVAESDEGDDELRAFLNLLSVAKVEVEHFDDATSDLVVHARVPMTYGLGWLGVPILKEN